MTAGLMWQPETLPTVYTIATTIRPKANEIMPKSAPENGAFEPPSRRRIAGTDPAPTKTSNAVPIASANARWIVECSCIGTSYVNDPQLRCTGRVARLPTNIRHCRTPFGGS